ncbi:MAG TPA: DUF4062 domain-containing protein [Longimicrobium sp.]|jgi:hypothetical protein|uniref:DUF4062 domain-containing protein n=1 Tax=Longimicrobium sp. TaxID=2029185 RepID=UPI002ED8DE65
MQPKYQVFVSSTFEDLRTERDQIIKATLEMGHIPVGMEMFSAADEEQWKVIARTIDQSDYYVVIVAHRYGSLVGKISYTEREYDYAIQQGVPVIGFVLDENAVWPPRYIEDSGAMRSALQAFKAKIRKKPVGFWTSAEDLHGRFSIALMKLIVTNPRPGWVRSRNVLPLPVLADVGRLSSENVNLRSRLELLESGTESEDPAGVAENNPIAGS